MEQKYVFDFYNNIADEFNRTRAYVWKGVKNFIDKLPTNSFLGEIGCGNGRNLLYRKDIKTFGCDTCKKLLDICSKKKLNVKYGNIIDLPFKDNTFDNTICIAVIHHLTTFDKRIKAVNELVRVTKKNGKILFCVWSLQQPKKSRRIFNKGDNIVPWVTPDKKNTYDRYCHVFTKDELVYILSNINNITITDIFNEMGNWYVELNKN